MSAIADKHQSVSYQPLPRTAGRSNANPRSTQTALHSQIFRYLGLFAAVTLASAVGLYIAESILVASVH